jgi:hypothetical protein
MDVHHEMSLHEFKKVFAPMFSGMPSKLTQGDWVQLAHFLKVRDISNFDTTDMPADISPAEIAMMQETTKRLDALVHTCASCQTVGREFKKCARCKQRRYCSKQCQCTDWKNGHNRQCEPELVVK